MSEVDPTPDIRIVGGSPSTEEIAATTAVLDAVLEELAAEHGRVKLNGQSGWTLSQRPIRQMTGLPSGGWRNFSA